MKDDYSKLVDWCNTLQRKIEELSARVDKLESMLELETAVIGFENSVMPRMDEEYSSSFGEKILSETYFISEFLKDSEKSLKNKKGFR